MTDQIPTNWGPMLRCHGVRGSQIGDSISALAVYAWLRQHAPDVYTIWQVARKHAHAVPLFYNHDLISELAISDCNEGYGPRDIAQANTCHVRLPLLPDHIPGEVWPNARSFYAETFAMSGLPVELYHAMDPVTRRPKLAQWFEVDKQPRTIGYFPCAAYGATQIRRSRHATRPWAEALVARLRAEGWRVIQFGHLNDHADTGGGLGADVDARRQPFMTQIIGAVGCAAVIGTDSGAAIALAGYGIPQVSLLTDHYPNHTTNLTAFQPDNPNNVSLVGIGSADAIPIDTVVEMLKQVISS